MEWCKSNFQGLFFKWKETKLLLFSTDAIWKFQCESTGDCAWEKVQTLAKARTNFATIPIPDDKVDELLDCS